MLKNQLDKIIKKSNRRFHMPGHKGRGEVFSFYDYDITEIPGADNLHQAQEVIFEVQKKLAEIYQSREASILVNGTTTGIHSAILGTGVPGKKLLVPVNCHRSVFGAMALGRIEGVFITPELNQEMGFARSVSVAEVERALRDHPEINGMILTNPTYYGTISDIKTIGELLHQQGKFLIVDEAHGAHLRFHQELPMDALAAGADVVIQSTHKILGSFTQSSLIHFQGNRVDPQRIKDFLALLQSSSPSYPLMISVEEAVDEAWERGGAIFEKIIKAHRSFCLKQNPQAPIILFEESGSDYDRSKWLFQTRGISGAEVERRLAQEYQIQCELSGVNYVLAMTGMGTTGEDLESLIQGINGINESITTDCPKKWENNSVITSEAQSDLKIRDFSVALKTEVPLWEAMYEKNRKKRPLKDATGRLAGDFIIPYPPGIPLLLPGSRISQEMLDYIEFLLNKGIAVVGIDKNREVMLMEKETKSHE